MTFRASVGKGVLFSLALAGALAAGTRALATSSGASGAVDANIFVNLSKKVVPSVVNISTLLTVKSPLLNRGGGPDDLFRLFEEMLRQHGGRGGGGDEDDDSGPAPGPVPKGGPRAMSLGTGFIIDASGLILTNNHVVADADEVKIQFTEETDEKLTDGEVVGKDPELDLALIRVKSSRTLVPISLGDSDALEVGEYVIAVGNPFGQGHSVTHGIISAKERKSPDFPLMANYLQTDAPINPGNSGGPLVNLRGEVVGINNAIDQRAQGIGFAIPINAVKKVLPQLRSSGKVSRGYIGVLVNDLTPDVATKLGLPKDLRAPVVTNVYEGAPAAKAGIKPYDVILALNGKAIHSPGDLVTQVTAIPVGETVEIKVSRAGEEKALKIKLEERDLGPKVAKKNGKKGKDGKKPTRFATGMDLEDMTPEMGRELGIPEKSQTGVVVTAVGYGGPAERSGILRGDVILEVDRKPIKDVESFYAVVKAKKSYLLRVRRNGPQGEAFSVIALDLKEPKDEKEE